MCDEVGIDYFSSPYDFEATDFLVPYVPAIKIGSGEVTWPEALAWIARKGLPVLLATGASDIGEVAAAVRLITAINPDLVLMQCNTNYTASLENFDHIHLNVLKTYARCSRTWCWACRTTPPATPPCWARWRWARAWWRSISPTTMTGSGRTISLR